MSYKNLKRFICKLEKKNEIITIKELVDPNLEITEIADRVSKANGPALLFENVKGSKFPILINAMGSYDRMALALGVDNLDQIGDEITSLITLSNYMSIKKIIKSVPKLLRLLCVFPIKVPFKGSCQEVINKDPDLSEIPVIKCWPEDGGPFITLPLVFTKDPITKSQNIGMYRLQVFDKNTTGMHWHLHKDGREIYDTYKKLGGKMPVSVALGCDPAITYSATAPLPKFIDETMLAGWLRKKPVKMVKSITNDIYVPADAEFIIEGYVDVNEDLKWEGPFGDHTGYYSLADYYPAFHVTCITHKKDAIYPTTIVGKPPMEDCYMGKATERIFLPLMKMLNPEIVDVNFPLEGVFHSCVIVSIKKRYPGHSSKVMSSLWGMGQMMYTKMIIVVDGDVDVQNYQEVLKATGDNVDFNRDIFMNEGTLDALDHASSTPFFGSRIGIDGTTKLPEERSLQQSDETSTKTTPFAEDTFKEILNSFAKNHSSITSINIRNFGSNNYIGIISVNKKENNNYKEVINDLWKIDIDGKIKLLIIVDKEVNIGDLSEVAWKAFNNIDGKRDLTFDKENRKDRICVDATRKLKNEGHLREWPKDIEMSEDIKKLVTERWEKYGIR